MTLFMQNFHRINYHTAPIMEQNSSVLFESDDPVDSKVFFDDMWAAMWVQNPQWLLSHGPSIIGFQGWSSVMTNGELIQNVEKKKEKPVYDLTGDGISGINDITFHPWCPDDLRAVLKKAFDRGVASKTNKGELS